MASKQAWGELKSQHASLYNINLKCHTYMFGLSSDDGKISLSPLHNDETRQWFADDVAPVVGQLEAPESTESTEPKRQKPFISRLHFTITRKTKTSPPFLSDHSLNGTSVNGRLVGKGNKMILKTGDTISILPQQLPIYKFINFIDSQPTDFPKKMTDQYFIDAKSFSRGAMGKIHIAYESNGQKFAIKMVKKIPLCENEANIMLNLKHPCIVKLLDAVETPNAWFIQMDFFEGGSLDDLIKRDQLSEELSKFFFYQLLKGVEYLHGLGIVHRDLKPKNIVIKSSTGPYSSLKIIDFGISKTDSCLKSCIGTYA